jgi:hypothetical protein
VSTKPAAAQSPDLSTDVAEVKADLRGMRSELRYEMQTGFNAVDKRFERSDNRFKQF